MKITPHEIKDFIIDVLDLEDLLPEDIGDEESLFGGGLGLDSIDALEIGVALRKRYKVGIEADDPEIRSYFETPRSLAEFVNRFTNNA
jgi:acyl carrier protein